jgi:hypothetical protein
MSNFQKKVIKEYEQKGYLVIKSIRLNKTGFPDLQCLKKDHIDVWIECKEDNDVLSALQKYRIEQLRKLGKNAFCLHNKKGVIF